MIVEALCNAIKSVLFTVFDFVSLPSFSDTVISRINDFFSILEYATEFIAFFVPPSVSSVLFPIWIGLFSIDKLYPIIIWIIHKLPINVD